MSVPLNIAEYDDYVALVSPNKAEQVLRLERAQKAIEERLTSLRTELLEETKKHGVLTLKTEGYTITRQTRETLRIEDHRKVAQELDAQNIPVATETVLSDSTKKVLKELLKQGTEVDGASLTSTEYVSIRLAK